MQKRAIAVAVRMAFGELAQALYWCWPGGDARWEHERNISLYIAHQLRDRGFFTYHEAALHRSRKNGKVSNEALDLLAVNIDTGVVVAVESKKLSGSTEAAGIANDCKRIANFLRTFGPSDAGDFDVTCRIGVTAAITRNVKYVDWWSFSDADLPEGARAKNWKAIGRAINAVDSSTHWGNAPLWRDGDGTEQTDSGYGVYAVFGVT